MKLIETGMKSTSWFDWDKLQRDEEKERIEERGWLVQRETHRFATTP